MQNPFASAYTFWVGIPPEIREPVKSATVSLGLGLMTAIGTLGSAYFADHPYDLLHPSEWIGFFHYLLSPHSIGAMFVAVGAVHRARQGSRRVKDTFVTRSGATAVLIAPAPSMASKTTP